MTRTFDGKKALVVTECRTKCLTVAAMAIFRAHGSGPGLKTKCYVSKCYRVSFFPSTRRGDLHRTWDLQFVQLPVARAVLTFRYKCTQLLFSVSFSISVCLSPCVSLSLPLSLPSSLSISLSLLPPSFCLSLSVSVSLSLYFCLSVCLSVSLRTVAHNNGRMMHLV